MRRIVIISFLIFISHLSTVSAQSWTAENGNGTFTNPLFYDEFSDPDIIHPALQGLGKLGECQLLF